MTSVFQDRQVFLITVFLLIFRVFPLFSLLPGESPAEEQWLDFITFNAGIPPHIPEDEKMGLLADLRNPDPAWASALKVCDEAFILIGQGKVPENLFLPEVKVPLSLEFSEVLSGGGKDVIPRYALPQREGRRIAVQVRLSGEGTGNDDEIRSFGYIYLTLVNKTWFIDQWMLDLSVFPDLQAD